MNKLVEEATKENVLMSIKENKYNRAKNIKDFIEALDAIEGNMFISLDAKWGAGKTFYVRQIEQTLDYLTRKIKKLNVEAKIETVFSRSPLGSLELKYTYFPVYYNAWLYDNHSDPLMSLILIITKIYESYCDTKLGGALSEKIIALLDSFSFSMGNIQLGSNFKNAKEKFSGKDILSAIKTEEEIRDKVKEIFDSIITENVQKLVIFIDELDRCRPNFAIEMLERIKHYFDDDRIIFVASINREQLIHSISKYYGTNFDSTGYLDKFFDINIDLPEIDDRYIKKLNLSDNRYFIENITNDLCRYYHLSIRERLHLYQAVLRILTFSYSLSDENGEKMVLSAFVPIIIVLSQKDQGKKMRFIGGDSSVLDEFFHNIPILHWLACRFGIFEKQESEENFKIGYEKIKKVYDYTFGDKKEEIYNGEIKICNNFKNVCMKLCNGFNVTDEDTLL